MNWLQVASLIISSFTFLGVGAFFAERWKHRAERVNQADDEREQEKEKRIENAIRNVVRDEISDLNKQIVEINNKLDILTDGEQATLKHELYQIYDEWIKENYCPREVKVNFENIYNNYSKLVTNDIIMAKCHANLISLPDNKLQVEEW